MPNTPPTNSNFSFTGWGTGATLNVLASVNQRMYIRVVAGLGAIVSPIITFTYPDGPYPLPPLCLARLNSTTGQVADIAVDRNALFPASTTFIYLGLPLNGAI